MLGKGSHLTSATCTLSYGATDGLSSMALKMASVATRESMGSAHSKEGRNGIGGLQANHHCLEVRLPG